ncbi:MAG: hypothetical protein JW850_03665 [Thermoflexales bacterium]|nr:hypothetical protein [Thermoflexales bacterium]
MKQQAIAKKSKGDSNAGAQSSTCAVDERIQAFCRELAIELRRITRSQELGREAMLDTPALPKPVQGQSHHSMPTKRHSSAHHGEG